VILRCCLAVGLLLNAALALWPASRPVLAGSQVCTGVAASVQSAPAEGTPGSDLLLDSFLAIPASQRLEWKNLSPDNLPEHVRRLRLAGCPESVVRSVIRQRLNEIYDPKIKAVVDPIQNAFYQLIVECRGDLANVAQPQQEELETLGRERKDLEEQLLGDESRDDDDDPDLRSPHEPWKEFISPELKKDVDRIEAAFSQNVAAAQRLPATNRASRLADLENQKQAELLWTLGPERYQEWKLRNSGDASQAMNAAGFRATPGELRAIVQLHETVRQETAEQGNPKAAAQLFESRFRDVFGPERWAQYDRGRDSQFQEDYLFAMAEGLPVETAEAIWHVHAEAENSASDLKATSSSPRERQMAIDALRLSALDAVARQLGPQAIPRYLEESDWIRGLR
jgi:hypothetical protein